MPKAVNGHCVATADTCKGPCKQGGYCKVVDEYCTATAAGCKASADCAYSGNCTAKKTEGLPAMTCGVGSDADCAQSSVCKSDGKCRMVKLKDGRTACDK